MNEHFEIINKLLDEKEYLRILDLGSGRTSLGILLNKFPNSNIDGICYPGDNRKLNSIKENCKGNYNLIEMDICKEQPVVEYDFVLCHLLLGEALKFGNNVENMINGLFKINTKEICIIDYFEDVDIDFELVKKIAKNNGFSIEKELIVEEEKEEVYQKFIGKSYIGFLLKKI